MIYHKQEKDYTCLLACFRTIIDTNISEQDLEKIFRSDPSYGTDPKYFVKICRENFNVHARYSEHSSYDMLDSISNFEKILLISLDVPHCVVYLRQNNNHITYYDPFYNKEISVLKKKFISPNANYPNPRWKTDLKSLGKYYSQDMFDHNKIQLYEGERQVIYITKSLYKKS